MVLRACVGLTFELLHWVLSYLPQGKRDSREEFEDLIVSIAS